jgi:hypothetical protein
MRLKCLCADWLTFRFSTMNPASQFYDLIEIFRIGGYSPHTNYLFLGGCRRLAKIHKK